ncbi:MAG: hypothetical protein WAV21_01915 [Minisyncoccia bacterium]
MYLRWLLAALFASSLLAGLHMWALTDFIYWRYRWFDTVMHLLGGITIGIFAVALLRSYRPFAFVLVVATIAIAWEIFEASIGIAVFPGVNYTWDTAHDILNDTLGAVLVYIVARYTLWRPVSEI